MKRHLQGAATVGGTTRYFFSVFNGDFYQDECGTCLSGVEEAIAYGSRVAHELAGEGGWDGYAIAITDANGNDIARIRIVPPLSTNNI